MNFQLIKGHFSPKEAIDLITQMISVKIKFQESKINELSNEEDIKMREKRIKELQKDLYEIRKHIESSKTSIDIKGEIEIG